MSNPESLDKHSRIVGLIPAAGKGSRLGQLPFSKELLPLIGPADLSRHPDPDTRTAIDNALETLVSAGIADASIVINPDKQDIPDRTGNGQRYRLKLHYVVAENSPSVPASLDSAFYLTSDCETALLFPDIVFEPRHALRDIVALRRTSKADIALALVPTSSGEKIDIVTTGRSGVVEKVTAKPGAHIAGLTWVAAVWNPRFSNFMHDSLPDLANRKTASDASELYVADVINAAIDAGMRTASMAYPDGHSFDLGTHEELARYWESGTI